MYKILTILGVLFLTACMVGPNYHEPPKSIAKHWSDKGTHVTEQQVRNANWWQVFHDPILTSLIHQGYQNNLSLQSAAVKVLQTRAQLAQAVGNLYPQQQALTGNLTYYRIGGSYLQNVVPSSFEAAMGGGTASWELDFWGKYR